MDQKSTVADMMAAYARDAVDHAETFFGVALDYSRESVQLVEEILGRLHAAMPRGPFSRLVRTGPSPEEAWAISKMYGGYLGEVLRRAGGGEWMFDTEVIPGENTICLRKGGTCVFPPSKVHQRLTDGPEDNVRVYFQVLMDETWG